MPVLCWIARFGVLSSAVKQRARRTRGRWILSQNPSPKRAKVVLYPFHRVIGKSALEIGQFLRRNFWMIFLGTPFSPGPFVLLLRSAGFGGLSAGIAGKRRQQGSNKMMKITRQCSLSCASNNANLRRLLFPDLRQQILTKMVIFFGPRELPGLVHLSASLLETLSKVLSDAFHGSPPLASILQLPKRVAHVVPALLLLVCEFLWPVASSSGVWGGQCLHPLGTGLATQFEIPHGSCAIAPVSLRWGHGTRSLHIDRHRISWPGERSTVQWKWSPARPW